MNKELAEKLVKKVLPTFHISGIVGQGSFGAVFKIKDDLKERVAKIVPLHSSTGIENGVLVSAEAKTERDFRHIVESYERIACEEIATVYDFYMVRDQDEGGTNAYALVIMELYPTNLGGFVIDHYRRTSGPLDIAAARDIMEKIALMLGNLYTKHGFLFEDFKPENILVRGTAGDLKLVVGDIGGLKNVVSITQSISQVTPNYCAPEVIKKAQTPDMRSVIYSYGLLSFFVLEGHLPYEGKALNARFDLVRSQGAAYSRADIPDNIRSVISRCLAFEPEQRFTSFDEALRALKGSEPERGGFFDRSDGPQASDFDAATIKLQPKPQPAAVAAPQDDYSEMWSAPQASIRLQSPSVQFGSIKLKDEKQALGKAEREIEGRVVRRGEVLKILREDVRITGSLVIERGATLVLERAKLFFAPNTGIIVLGSIKASHAHFTASDPAQKWNNIAVFASPESAVSFEDCVFNFGKGIKGAVIKERMPEGSAQVLENAVYGGGLFVAGTAKALTFRRLTFNKCSAHDGGGAHILRSNASLDESLFDGCTATQSGGGVAVIASEQAIRKCTFNKCLAGRDGGGISYSAAAGLLEDSRFMSCFGKYHGGGVNCASSKLLIKKCHFELCSASKAGGAIFADNASRPGATFLSFSKCKPDDANFKI